MPIVHERYFTDAAYASLLTGLFFGGVTILFCFARAPLLFPDGMRTYLSPGEWFWYRQDFYRSESSFMQTSAQFLLIRRHSALIIRLGSTAVAMKVHLAAILRKDPVPDTAMTAGRSLITLHAI